MATTKTKTRAVAKPKSKPAARPKTKPAAKKPPKAAAAPTSLSQAMAELEKAGSAQTRKTYARHGATEPMFGVSFATLKTLTKRIGVNHELACALWKTGNFDARNLAVKVADPSRMTSADLDRWVRETPPARMCGGYVAMLAAEGKHGARKADQWLASKDARERAAGWTLLHQLAHHDEAMPDAWFERRLAEIERTIHAAPNSEREVMSMAVIAIGCRNARLRKLAATAAKRIGKVDVDYGDTACKTPDAASYIDKTWAHSTSKGFESPAAHERTRELMRVRC